MRTRSITTLTAALGAAALLTLTACAAPATSTAAGATDNAPISAAALTSAPVPAAAVSSAPVPVSSAAAGTADSIPPAPGTVGSAALPPSSTAAPVTSGPGAVAASLPSCTPAQLQTRTPEKLIFTSAGTTTAPWFGPTPGSGYEGAVASAVAHELGYPASDVSWTTATRAQILAGKATTVDVAVSEFPIPDQTSTVVDYSTGYFSISNSVVALAGSKTASAAGLSGLRIGVTSSTSDAARTQLAGSTISSYPSTAAALAALRSGAVAAAVLPTPAAVTASGITVVGQLPDGNEQPQQFGMVLAKNSPLTACVSAAVDQLRVTSTLTSLAKTWVPAAVKPLN